MGAILRKYGAATTVLFPLVDAGTVDFEATPVSFVAGDTQISKDEGAFANTSNNPAHEGKGIYSLALTATEMQAARIVVVIVDSATKAWEDQAVIIDTYGNASAQHAVDLNDSVRAGLIALPNAAAEAAGGLFTRGTGAGQVNQDANGRLDVNVEAWDAAAVPAQTVAGVPEVDVTHFAGGAIPTPAATGVPDVNVTHVGDTVQTAGDLAALVTTVDTVVDAIKAVTDNLPDSGALSTIDGILDDLKSATILHKAAIESVTNQFNFVIPATDDATDDDAYKGCTAIFIDQSDPNQKSVRHVFDYTASSRTVTVEVAPDFTVVAGDTLIISPVQHSDGIADMVLQEGVSAHSGVSDSLAEAISALDTEVTQLHATTILASGTIDTGTPTTTTGRCTTLTQADTDWWKGKAIVFTAAPQGQVRRITGFNPATDELTWTPALTQAPTATLTTFRIIPWAEAEADLLKVNGVAQTTDLDAIVADTNELQGDWADGGRLDLILDARASQATADAIEADTQDLQTQIGTAGAGLTDLGGMSTGMKAEVEAEANDALVALHLDHLLAADYDPASKPGIATALLNELVEDDGGVSRFTVNALEQAPSGGGSGAVGSTSVYAGLYQVSEATAERRRVYLLLQDPATGAPETGEAAGQPQISKNGAAFANTSATLTAVANGLYYVELTAGELDTAGFAVVRYKSANTQEAQATLVVSALNLWDGVRAGMTALPAAAADAAGGLPVSDAGGLDLDGRLDAAVSSRAAGTLFTGITSVAEWLGLLAGKQTGDATARTEIRATGAGSGTFDETEDSLEALRDRGDAAWATGGGGALTQVLNVQPLIPQSVDLAPTATVRLGLMLTNAVDDLPSTAEITPGTISIDRKAKGVATWTPIETDAVCLESAGLIYFDEVFDSGSGYAEGDSIRITFKSQSITADANDHEITDATGRIFYTAIRETVKSILQNVQADVNTIEMKIDNGLSRELVRGAGYVGDVADQQSIHLFFTTLARSGLPVTPSGMAFGVYKDGSQTESTAGIVYSEDHDPTSLGVGTHHIQLNTTDAFYVTGSDYRVVVIAGTVDGFSVKGAVVARFSIENRQPWATQDRQEIRQALGLTGTKSATSGGDLQDVQSRLPAALVSGRMDSSVGAVATDALSAGGLSAAGANKLADHVLRRQLANARASADGDAVVFRSPLGAMSKLVNKTAVNGTNLEVFEETDASVIGTQAITTQAGADPITGLDTV